MPTLLLADESITIQRVIALTFATENITVVTVNDGDEAIARIAEDRPDIVLAAIATPRRTGYDVAAFVKSTPELASIPVLLLAGAFDPVDEGRAQQVRCDGVLVKPFDPQQVVARVKELIDAAGRGPGDATAGGPQPAALLGPPRGGGSPSPSAMQSTAQRDHTPAPSSHDNGLDEYFERLDAAIATRTLLVPPAHSDAVEAVPTLDSVLEPSASNETARPANVSDALVDEVTRRVVERLGSEAVRDVVADVVAEVAERLIRAEIAQIRARS